MTSKDTISIFVPEGIRKRDLLKFIHALPDDTKVVLEIDVGIPPRDATLLLYCKDGKELYLS